MQQWICIILSVSSAKSIDRFHQVIIYVLTKLVPNLFCSITVLRYIWTHALQLKFVDPILISAYLSQVYRNFLRREKQFLAHPSLRLLHQGETVRLFISSNNIFYIALHRYRPSGVCNKAVMLKCASIRFKYLRFIRTKRRLPLYIIVR